MFLAAAVLTAAISVDINLASLINGARRAEPAATCNIKTVGWRFHGQPGQAFRYAGDTYHIPAQGWVELIADRRRTTYAFNGQTLSLSEESLRDPFGFRDVTLPTSDATPKGEMK